jgi:predicted transcriptional regulator
MATAADETNTERIIIQVPPTLREAVERLAKEEDRSMSAIARRAILEYVWTRTCKPKRAST